MSNKDIQKIIDETAFSMEAEGFVLTSNEKEDIKKVLSGEVSFTEQLKKYIDNAKSIGKTAKNSKYAEVAR
jgi:predicted methyltransferase